MRDEGRRSTDPAIIICDEERVEVELKTSRYTPCDCC